MAADFAERIKLLAGKRKQPEMAEIVGVHAMTWGRWERGETEPGLEDLLKIINSLKVNPEWLLTGLLPIYQDELAAGELPEHLFIPQVEGRVTAGTSGEINYDRASVEQYPFKSAWLKTFISADKRHLASLVLIRVQGDSMVPTIAAGDLVMVDTWEAARTEIAGGKIYLLHHPDLGIIVKRLALYNNVSGGRSLLCLSDNPAYRPVELALEPGKAIKNYVLGRVRWAGREFE